ncbi:hypothetical protein IEQ34_008445 [Dendrobium chrysotoxum]|uniref:Pectinesterase catalytic domain-containing protein n=1 Tax=Dendrobium chrysotoxum TaxID=161865 RepID=A0AAV7GXT0_DENCH|nr:hypothetical protein IEQ34_008445 [Dendrobium chrysotoxum]
MNITAVQVSGFITRSMGFTNTAIQQASHQAIALRLNANAAVIYNYRIDGFQDSFYSQSDRHFVCNSVISGTIKIIFGDSQVVTQYCLIILRHPMDNQKNTVTAHGKETQHEGTGIMGSGDEPHLGLIKNIFGRHKKVSSVKEVNA